VRFGYKDYRQEGVRREMELDDTEFIRRFALHILPPGFQLSFHCPCFARNENLVVSGR